MRIQWMRRRRTRIAPQAWRYAYTVVDETGHRIREVEYVLFWLRFGVALIF